MSKGIVKGPVIITDTTKVEEWIKLAAMSTTVRFTVVKSDIKKKFLHLFAEYGPVEGGYPEDVRSYVDGMRTKIGGHPNIDMRKLKREEVTE